MLWLRQIITRSPTLKPECHTMSRHYIAMAAKSERVIYTFTFQKINLIRNDSNVCSFNLESFHDQNCHFNFFSNRTAMPDLETEKDTNDKIQ